MATTWAGTANNQAVTRAALQDGINTNQLNFKDEFIPTTDPNKCIIRDTSFRVKYVYTDNFPSVASNELMMKSDYVTGSVYDYGIGIGGRRDGNNVDIYTRIPGGGILDTLNSSICKPIDIISFPVNSVVTMSVFSGSFPGQDIKFYLTEGGTTCPNSGTQYSIYTFTLTGKRNFLITPVWNGSSYVLV